MGLVNFRFNANTKLRLPHVQMEFSKVTPNIYVGTNQCCQTHYKLMLLDQGITHDVSLEGEHVDTPYGADSYLWLPTPDHTAPDENRLALGVDYLDDVIARGGRVYVHCKNGHGRSPTLVAAWMIAHGRSVDEAIEALKLARPETHLEPVQVEMLRRFEQTYDSRTSDENREA